MAGIGEKKKLTKMAKCILSWLELGGKPACDLNIGTGASHIRRRDVCDARCFFIFSNFTVGQRNIRIFDLPIFIKKYLTNYLKPFKAKRKRR